MVAFILIFIIIILDQVSKYWVVSYLKNENSIPLIKDIFHFTYAENTGAAFSFLSGKQTFLVILTSIVMAVMLVYLYRWTKVDGEFWQKIALAMVIGGGIGNLIDRIRLNYVIDFLDFRAINFAIFNIADSFIVVGAIILVIATMFQTRS